MGHLKKYMLLVLIIIFQIHGMENVAKKIDERSMKRRVSRGKIFEQLRAPMQDFDWNPEQGWGFIKNNEDKAFWLAAIHKDYGKLGKIIRDYQITIDCDPSTGNTITPLMQACKYGLVHIVRYLLEKGARVDTVNVEGRNALMFAACYGHVRSLKVLINEGTASIDAHDNNGMTALMLAAEKGHAQCVQFLLEKGANLNKRNSQKSLTATILAAKKYHADCLELLLQKNPRLNYDDAPKHLTEQWQQNKKSEECLALFEKYK